jgi:hypothetical protein
MSAEVPETPTPESRIEALQRLQSTIETLQGLATTLEAQPQMTVSEREIEALAALADRLQPVAILPSPSPVAAVPEVEIADVAPKSPATPLPEPLPPSPAAVAPQPEPNPSFIQQIFDRIPLKVPLIAIAIAVIFLAVLVKLLVFPFPKVDPLTGVPQAESIAPAISALPVPAKNEPPQVAISTPTAPTPEVPIENETSQIVVVPSSNSETGETPQIVVVPSSNSETGETSQIVVVPSSNSETGETSQIVVVPPSNSETGETSQIVVVPPSNSETGETSQIIVVPPSTSTNEETSQTVVPSPRPATTEPPSEPLPQVVTIVPEPANDKKVSKLKEDTYPSAEIPIAVEVPASPAKPNLPPEPAPLTEPEARKSVPAVPAKLTPEQRFIASIQTQVTQTAQKYVEDPSIESLNANFEDSLLQIRVADRWFGLASETQNQLAENWMKQAKAFDFQTLEIVDRNGSVVARSPVVGSQMIILKR